MKARKIQESAIMHAPPHVREIWDLFLCRACHSDNDYLKRGQLRMTYEDIREALHWMIGWRKMRYSKWDCEKALKWLKKATMITTEKTTKGVIVTVCNYSLYQNPKSYESHNESFTKAIGEPQSTDTIYKKVKKSKNEKNVNKKNKHVEFVLLTSEEYQKLVDRFGVEDAKTRIERLNNYIGSKGKKYKSHYHTILNWAGKDEKPDRDYAFKQQVERASKEK